MRRSLLCAGAALVAVAVATPEARAQGSAVMTHSSCATAMGAAGVARPCEDGSAVLFNPAALATQSSVIGLGWTSITTSGAFEFDPALGGTRFERDATSSSVPFGYLNYRVNDRLAAAIGVFAPYGLGVYWDEEDTDFEGRFVSYDTNLSNIYIQPTLSFAVTPNFSIGAGVDIVRSSIEINQRVDLATTPLPTNPDLTFANLGVPMGSDFANATLEGDATSYTFHLGALMRLGEVISAGIRYLHSADPEFEGDAAFRQVNTGIVLPAGNPISQPGNPFGIPAGSPVPLDALLQGQFAAGGSLVNQSIQTQLPTPAQLVVGVAITPTPAVRLLADYQWTGWSKWDEATIDFETAPDQVLVLDYQDTDTYRLGAELDASDALALRAGFIYNTAAQREFSVSPLLPEAERNYYSLGIGYRFTDQLRFDAGYQLVDQSDRRGRVRGRPEGATDAQLEALNVGLYTTDAHLFNLTLAYQFGGWR